MNKNLLSIDNLTVEFFKGKKIIKAVDKVSFCLSQGEICGLVGESGSGKTMTALSIAGLLPKSSSRKGSINFLGKELTKLSEKEIRALNGKKIGIIFQEPMTSLNPVIKVGNQVEEVLKIHESYTKEERTEKVKETLTDVGLNNVEDVYNKYPHQLSGGMRQRIMIAMAVICKPDLIIADEPTTALDAALQAQILELLKRINKEKGITIILISHNLRIIKSICDNVLIMHKGNIVESGKVNEIFNNPKHEYTKELVNISFNLKKSTHTSIKGRKNVLKLDNVNIYYKDSSKGLLTSSYKSKIVKDVSITLNCGEILGIVGESGSGKTTLAKAIAGLIKDVEGSILISGGNPQMVFQDPYSSLNPSKKIGWILEEPLKINGGYTKKQRNNMVSDILEQVGLKEELKTRYPGELSGGQRQRVSIASALILNRNVIILDEPVSALDVTVGEQILRLLLNLREKYSLSYIFISHDLNIVYRICDSIVVMHNGCIVERGTGEEVYNRPQNEYTKKLLETEIYLNER